MKRRFPRFRAPITVRLRIVDPDSVLPEECTVTEDIGQGGAMDLTRSRILEGEVFDIEEVGGSFEARARVAGVYIGDDKGRCLNLQFVGEDSEDRARELLRRLGLLSTGHVMIESEVPDEHPEKDAIEEALKESLQRAPGDWRIEIALATAFTPPWWLVSSRASANGSASPFARWSKGPPTYRSASGRP